MLDQGGQTNPSPTSVGMKETLGAYGGGVILSLEGKLLHPGSFECYDVPKAQTSEGRP